MADYQEETKSRGMEIEALTAAKGALVAPVPGEFPGRLLGNLKGTAIKSAGIIERIMASIIITIIIMAVTIAAIAPRIIVATPMYLCSGPYGFYARVVGLS